MMQFVRAIEQEEATLVGYGIRVLLLTAETLDGPIVRRLAGLGGRVAVEAELFTALATLIDDPVEFSLFVIDCDSLGGLEVGRKAFAMLGETTRRVPVILISRDCERQRFPDGRGAPTELRVPLSGVSLRVGFEHALRDRLAVRMIGDSHQAA